MPDQPDPDPVEQPGFDIDEVYARCDDSTNDAILEGIQAAVALKLREEQELKDKFLIAERRLRGDEPAEPPEYNPDGTIQS